MPSQEAIRYATYVALCAGLSPPEIIKTLKIGKKVVYTLFRRFHEFVGDEDDKEDYCCKRKEKEVARAVRNPEFVGEVKQKIKENPRVSMRKISRDMKCSDWTVRQIVKEDLGYKSYKLRARQLITESQQESRATKTAALLNELKHDSAKRLRFFSDEKNFTQEQKINKQNHRYLTDDPDEVPVVVKIKFPINIMVLGVISSEGDIMPPYFFEKGLRVNSDEYIKVLRDVVVPWMNQVASGRPYVFQQDSAPAHASKKTLSWLYYSLPDEGDFWPPNLWPPNSPDLNPMDYFVWGVLEEYTNKSFHTNAEAVRQAVVQGFQELDRDAVLRACKSFRKRLEAVNAAGGSYIE